jgi:hypothetical protein
MLLMLLHLLLLLLRLLLLVLQMFCMMRLWAASHETAGLEGSWQNDLLARRGRDWLLNCHGVLLFGPLGPAPIMC